MRGTEEASSQPSAPAPLIQASSPLSIPPSESLKMTIRSKYSHCIISLPFSLEGSIYVARACSGPGLRHRRATRPDAASIARLVPRSASAPAARASSLGYFGRLRAPRPGLDMPLRDFSVEDPSQLRRVDVAAGHHADHLSAARLSRQSSGHRGRAGALGDDTVSFGKEANGPRSFGDGHDEGAGEKSAGEGPHFRQHGLAPDTVHEARGVVDGDGL